MVVTDYHVQTVLRTYSRQLQRARAGAALGRPEDPPGERVTISEDARRLVMERAASQALETARSVHSRLTQTPEEGLP